MTDEDKIKQMLRSDEFRLLGFDMAINHLGWCEFECIDFLIEWLMDFDLDFDEAKPMYFTCFSVYFEIEKNMVSPVESYISVSTKKDKTYKTLYENCFFLINSKNDRIRAKTEIKAQIFHFLRNHF